MSELHVRNLSPQLQERLREQASREGRSMSSEAVAILERALLEDDRSARQHTAIDRLRQIQQRSHIRPGVPAAEQLVRDDRDTAT